MTHPETLLFRLFQDITVPFYWYIAPTQNLPKKRPSSPSFPFL